MADDAPGAGEPPFIADARAFARRHRSHPAFVILGWFVGASPEEADVLIQHLYCAGLPSNTIQIDESPARTVAGLALLPLYYLATKKWWWRPAARTDCNVETIDPAFFNRGFSRLYPLLRGSRRLTPREGGDFGGEEKTLPCLSSVLLQDLLRLAVVLPAWIPALALLSWRTGLNFLRTCRQAVAVYLCYSGYFRRFPCRRFVTFDDMPNHPCRQLAFKRHGGEEQVSIQNGERGLLPQCAFGMVDHYCVFGPAHVGMMRSIGTRAAVIEPVGALWLNAWRDEYLRETAEGMPPPRYDIIFIDQGAWPHNGVPKYFDDALLELLDNLAEFGRRHPTVGLFYQLRPYGTSGTEHRAAVLRRLQTRYQGVFTVLENDGKGQSYGNILRAKLVVTFESSLGFESLMMGKKALFVNYSGNPGETACPDSRFQIEDESADYPSFEAKVSGLLAAELREVPQAARDRCGFFDGRTQERVAESIARARAPL